MAVTTDSAITAFSLVRMGSTTHTVNNDQRRVPLQFTSTGSNAYSLQVPSNPGIALPGLYSGQCATVNGANVLTVRLNSDPNDARIDDVGGDVRFGPVIAKNWGLHMIDVNLVMQDMVDLVPVQLTAWERMQRR
ncbi:MAG: DUF1929 domain-containing protein [Sphingopyxis sp.]|nr:DUF1929 domain-containing protein [Sphingopyxis sp.]